MTSTASVFSNVFSQEDIQYLIQLPEVVASKTKIKQEASYDAVYFTIPLTASIRNSLQTRLGLDFSSVSEIPMRWIKGDITPHIDVGLGHTDFENTYLVYINSNSGEFILDEQSYPITENTAYVFNEGLLHKTQNTGSSPRLLVGPMNELAAPVGIPTTILYFSNYADAAAGTNYIAFSYSSFVLGDTPTQGSIGAFTSWRVASVVNLPTPTGVYNNGFDLSVFGNSTYFVYPSAPCFLEGTKILCQVDGVDAYIPIETVKKGTLVKTRLNGYKKVEMIGKGEILNPGDDERIENRLYKCSPDKYPELEEDLYITGCHSILVGEITDIQLEKTVEHMGKVYITENRYRLIACIDERAEPWNSEGSFTIWHIALENEDIKMNYGIYANGLLVETCSLSYLTNHSGLKIQ